MPESPARYIPEIEPPNAVTPEDAALIAAYDALVERVLDAQFEDVDGYVDFARLAVRNGRLVIRTPRAVTYDLGGAVIEAVDHAAASADLSVPRIV